MPTGLVAVGVGALGSDDDGRGLAQQEQQVGLYLPVEQHQRVLVHHLGGQAGEQALVLVGALVAAGAVEGEPDGRRVARLAVVKAGVAAQAKV